MGQRIRNSYIATVYTRRGLSKARLHDDRGAISDFTKAIEIDPSDETAYYNRGITKLEYGRKNDSACMDLSKAAELGHERAYEAMKEFCTK